MAELVWQVGSVNIHERGNGGGGHVSVSWAGRFRVHGFHGLTLNFFFIVVVG